MKRLITTKNALILILVVAAILRFDGISRGDTVSDEVFYGFRAIGPMDFDEAAEQTTPWEWFDGHIPWWAQGMFHDHPPLVFWIQHFSIRLFGENNFAIRFPSAFFGIASVYVLYLIGRRLYSERVGLIAAALLAVTVNHNYISRLGMQEAFVIFFLLLGVYFFIRALQDARFWLAAGMAFGFGFLAKYNTAILAPIFLTYLMGFRRDCFKEKYLWFGALIALALSSPVIVYNTMLYRAVGHFDFQFSYIFGQHPEVWKAEPGKEIGSLADRMMNFAPRMIATNSWLFLTLAAGAFVFGCAEAVTWIRQRRWREMMRTHALLAASIFWLLILFAKIGPAYRFLTMITPFFALAAALGLSRVRPRLRIFLLFIFAFEIFYTANNVIAYYPAGPTPWLASKVRYESYNWGYNALGDYFAREFDGKMPALTFDAQYRFLGAIQGQSLTEARNTGARRYPAMIVTYGNFDRGAKLWVLDRLRVYHGWPVISLDTYFQYLRENGPDYYDRSGFKNYYFVTPTSVVPIPEFQALVRGLKFIDIKNPRGDVAFKVYIR